MAERSLGPAGVVKERAEQYQGRVTCYVVVTCLIAAVGGSIFGYDIGISGVSLSLCNQFFNLLAVCMKFCSRFSV